VGSTRATEPAHDSELLLRIADTVSIMLYQLEFRPDETYTCLELIGLETLIGKPPHDITPEDAYDAAVHPEDRPAYMAAAAALHRGEPIEVEYRLVGYDGRTRWVLDRMRPEQLQDGRVLVDGIVADITDRRLAETELEAAQKLAQIALHDALTGLPNRISFQDHLDLALARAERNGCGGAVLFVDLDNFKLINDSFGHAAGDELLAGVARQLRAAVRKTDLVARHSGDEFLILLSDLKLEDQATSEAPSCLRPARLVARKIGRILREPITIEGVEIYASASVGISLYPNDGADAQTLLKHADVAMYGVKQSGRDSFQHYAVENDTALTEISTVGRLRRAIEHGHGLVLHYQPLVNLESGEILGVEALIRWDDGRRGLVAPAEFIPLAERVGLIGPISDWVVDEACRQLSDWSARGLDVDVSINLPPSYCRPHGMGRIVSSARAAGIDPKRLVIEVTESALLPDVRADVEPTLERMRKRGFRLAIDDFGTGYSSLGRLRQSWVSMLKIDRSFVQNLPHDEQASQLVASIIQLATALGLKPVAEGVETEAQRRFLVERGCRLGQGFLFSKPLSGTDVETIYGRSKALARGLA